MNKRYLRTAIIAFVMLLAVAFPIYAADEVDADGQVSQTEEQLDEQTFGQIEEQLDEQTVGQTEEQLDEQQNEEDLTPAEITADQLEYLTWGMYPITNEDQSNYWYFTAKFKLAGDEMEYEMFFTGFKYCGEKNPWPIAGLESMATDMALAFLNGKTFEIYDGVAFKDKYGFYFDPIDAEKSSLDRDTDGDPSDANYPAGDYNLCWAATDANIIQYTGWTTAAGEDTLFSIYRNNISNYTGTAQTGIEWFFNGVNTFQTVDENGNVIFKSYSEAGDPQQRTANTTEYVDYVSADAVLRTYNLKYYPNRVAMNQLMAALKAYNGVGLSLGYYDDSGARLGGHAVTCFGYIYETTYGNMRALFLADSDNSAGVVNPLNILTMSPVYYAIYDNGMGTYTISGYDNYCLDGINILTSYPNYCSEGITETGTKDIYNNCDIVIGDITVINVNKDEVMVMDETEEEDNINIQVQLVNKSYAKVNDGNGVLVMVRVYLYRGDTLIETFDRWTAFEPGSESNALSSLIFIVNKDVYTLPAYTTVNEEYYRLTGEILYVIDYNDEETSVDEAYVSNNKFSKDKQILCYVKGQGAGDEGSEYKEEAEAAKGDMANVAVANVTETVSAVSSAVDTGDSSLLEIYVLLIICICALCAADITYKRI